MKRTTAVVLRDETECSPRLEHHFVTPFGFGPVIPAETVAIVFRTIFFRMSLTRPFVSAAMLLAIGYPLFGSTARRARRPVVLGYHRLRPRPVSRRSFPTNPSVHSSNR